MLVWYSCTKYKERYLVIYFDKRKMRSVKRNQNYQYYLQQLRDKRSYLTYYHLFSKKWDKNQLIFSCIDVIYFKTDKGNKATQMGFVITCFWYSDLCNQVKQCSIHFAKYYVLM